MNLSDEELIVMGHIEQTIEGIIDLKSRVRIATQLLKLVNAQALDDTCKRRRSAYLRRKLTEDAVKPELRLLAKLSLGAGDLIKLKGTRDYGVREVINLEGNKVICHQLRSTSMHGWNTNSCLVESYRKTGIQTTHDLAKISHIARDGEWKDFKQQWTS